MLGGIMGGILLMMAFPILTGLMICMCGEVIGVLEIFTMGLSAIHKSTVIQ